MKAYLLLFVVSLAIVEKSGPYNGKPQVIPGKIEFEFYNNGGEGKAYHDSDAINNGSGKLNPVNGNPLNEFRIKEGVDISYTKDKQVDNSPYSKIQPELNSLYVGWTVVGEWTNYDVVVNESGEYSAELMYTSNGDGAVVIDIDGYEAWSEDIPSTNDANDSIAWRQWHHWNKIRFNSIELKKGKHQMKLKIVENGQMNFDYLELKRLQ